MSSAQQNTSSSNTCGCSSQSVWPEMTNIGGMFSVWQMPALYWQTVANIMNRRGQTVQACSQMTAQCCQELANCQSLAQLTSCLSRQQQRLWQENLSLMMDTHQQRAVLWSQLCKQWQQACTTTSGSHSQASTSSSSTQKSSSTPSNVRQTATSTTSSSNNSPAPTVHAPQATVPVRQPSFFQPGESSQTTASASSLDSTPPVSAISSNRDRGVMRSSTGATITAAAATRRSVVARRTQRSKLARAR